MAKELLGRFHEKGKQLQSILVSFLQDEEFLKLTQTDFSLPSNPYSLINTQLYTQVYMPPTDTVSVVVCVFFTKGTIGSNNTYFKNNDFTVAIIVHRDLWHSQNGLRAFDIADRVDYILNRNSTTDSLSTEWFKSFNYSPVDTNYSVLELKYSNWD